MADRGGNDRAQGFAIDGGLLARNAVLNLGGQAVPLLVAVVTMPFVVAGLGTDRFGILAVAWMIVGFFGELGVGRATTKYVAEALGRAADEELVSAVWVTALTQLALGVVMGVALFLATPWLVQSVLRVPTQLHDEARLAFVLLALTLPAVMVVASLRGVVEAAQRFDLVNLVRVPLSASNFLLPLVGLWLGWTLPGIVALLLTARVLAGMGFLAIAVQLFPLLRRPPTASLASLRRVLAFGTWVSVSSVVSPLLVYLDRFALGALVSMAAVGFYAAPYELISRAWIVPASLVATLFPAFSTLSGQAAWPDIQRLTARSVRHILAVLGPVVVLAVAVARDLLGLWLGAEFADASGVAFQILAIGVLVNSLALVPSSLLQGMERADLTAKFHLAELPVHVLVVWLCIRAWGVTGAAVAWTGRVGLDAVLLFLATRRLASVGIRDYVRERVPQHMALVLALAALGAVTGDMMGSFAVRIAAATVLTVVAAWLAWTYGLGRADRERIVRLVQVARAG